VQLKAFVRTVFNKYPTIKFLGICFGHQIIAEALGGKVEKNSRGWEVGWTVIYLNDRAQRFLHTDKSNMKIHQMHQDHVTQMPSGMRVFCFSTFDIYGFYRFYLPGFDANFSYSSDGEAWPMFDDSIAS
jgi:GMP synthase-like glutamine amidotransferase